MRSISNRNADLTSVIKTGVAAGTKSLRCACPAIVQTWNAETQTITAKLAIKEILNLQGVVSEMEIPLLVDVPVVMPKAGGFSLVFVPKPGDECLIVFADMCIDSWWQSGGIQSQAERRRHDLSDGFAIMGCWSQVRKPSFPTEGCRLQSDDGSLAIVMDSTGCHFEGFEVGVKGLTSDDKGITVGDSDGNESKVFKVCNEFRSEFDGRADFAGGASFRMHDDTNTALTIDGDLEIVGGTIKRANNWTYLADDGYLYANVVTEEDPINAPVRIINRLGTVHMGGIIYFNAAEIKEKAETEIAMLPQYFRPRFREVFAAPVWRTNNSYVNVFSVALIIEPSGKVIIKNPANAVIKGSTVSKSFISLNASWLLDS